VVTGYFEIGALLALDGQWQKLDKLRILMGDENRVYINKEGQYFDKGPEETWNFRVEGYQVVDKWLKDRKNRTLSDDDVEHYQKVVTALHETHQIMQEIDEVIESHGGWPLPGSVPEGTEVTEASERGI
jgi:hypothetical protein